MKKTTRAGVEKPQSVNSLTQVLGQSERVRDIVEECVEDMSSVNTGLKRELQDGDVSLGVENALEKAEAVESKVQDASEALSLVNMALKERSVSGMFWMLNWPRLPNRGTRPAMHPSTTL